MRLNVMYDGGWWSANDILIGCVTCVVLSCAVLEMRLQFRSESAFAGQGGAVTLCSI